MFNSRATDWRVAGAPHSVRLQDVTVLVTSWSSLLCKYLALVNSQHILQILFLLAEKVKLGIIILSALSCCPPRLVRLYIWPISLFLATFAAGYFNTWPLIGDWGTCWEQERLAGPTPLLSSVPTCLDKMTLLYFYFSSNWFCCVSMLMDRIKTYISRPVSGILLYLLAPLPSHYCQAGAEMNETSLVSLVRVCQEPAWSHFHPPGRYYVLRHDRHM